MRNGKRVEPLAAPALATAADHEAATRLATAAGELLIDVRRRGLEGRALKAAGDRASHEWLMTELAARFPGDAVLSEEGKDNPDRLGKDRVWIVDPLDGTREFSEPPRADWAVHVALAIEGTVVAGAVALPAAGITLGTARPPALPAVKPRAPRILVSRSRPTEHARVLADQLGGELVPMGSAGAKAMAVVRGEGDVYAHSGGQYEWDSAAPVAVAAAAGLHVSRLDGSPLRYNQPDPWLPDLLICRRELAGTVIDLGLERS
ncbi:3'(2'),5'-bisphosphate nucleotidase CysQ [Amycolatopsis sp. YIM 10]|uniref:3'(2'),5'-bisphosphate nucleotidase CysQ n=1 Tax=Amycolatopsis sp. YIM 10 TaxID=2653857 RepID=UPI0012905681|nr:3'(2'),5'-bisphosphate nucleotidase CysQ [Amycolatopsis sp. YIM 10]QFU92530.1 3'-phosphoadenosine 5'-phosphate phosphatase [Amycolatopsis sp. YIM 10]